MEPAYGEVVRLSNHDKSASYLVRHSDLTRAVHMGVNDHLGNITSVMLTADEAESMAIRLLYSAKLMREAT